MANKGLGGLDDLQDVPTEGQGAPKEAASSDTAPEAEEDIVGYGQEDGYDPTEEKGGRLPVAAVAAGVVALLGAGYWFLTSGGEPTLEPARDVAGVSATVDAAPSDARSGEPSAEVSAPAAAGTAAAEAATAPAPVAGKSEGVYTNLVEAASVPPQGHIRWEWNVENRSRGKDVMAFDNAAFWARPNTVALVVEKEFRVYPQELGAFFTDDTDLLSPRFNGEVLELTGLGYKGGEDAMWRALFGKIEVAPRELYIRLPSGSRPPVDRDTMYKEFDGVAQRVLGSHAVAIDMFPMNKGHTAYAVAVHGNPREEAQKNCKTIFCSNGSGISGNDLYWIVVAWDGTQWRAVASANHVADMGVGPHWVDSYSGTQVYLGPADDRQVLFTMVGSDRLFHEEFQSRDGRAYLTGMVVTAADRAPAGQAQRASTMAKNQPILTVTTDFLLETRETGFTFGSDLKMRCEGNGDGKMICRAPFTLVDATYPDSPKAEWSGELFAEAFDLSGDYVHAVMPLGTCLRMDMTETKYVTRQMRERGVPSFCKRR